MTMPHGTVAIALCAMLILALAAPAASEPTTAATPPVALHYDLFVQLQPDEHRLQARAAITLPPNHPRPFKFALHQGLVPSSPTPEVTITLLGQLPGPVPRELFQVAAPAEQQIIVIAYQGEIFHPLPDDGREFARGIRDTPGLIGPDGVFLSPAAAWYPQVWEETARGITARLRVRTPPEWSTVSQGLPQAPPVEAEGRETGWEIAIPQEGLYLLANRFTLYKEAAGRTSAQAFLRGPDDDLAARYLAATGRYLAMYEDLLGPYPYEKFALVENFWETGFGMPSFTLLGPTVIRLPFILHTSYPHEILHNWWGNGVYVDYRQGNWSEGLTSYLADHLLAEQQGKSREHRRAALQKYSDYAAGGRDFALTDFTSRRHAAAEAVGYGKSMMLFHMLRRSLGDQLFRKGLREFYRRHLFTVAGYRDLQTVFEEVSGRSLEQFFRQWVTRTGAPRLGLTEVSVSREQGGYHLTGIITQHPARPTLPLPPPAATGPGPETATGATAGSIAEPRPEAAAGPYALPPPLPPYLLEVPLYVTVEGGEEAYPTVVRTSEERAVFSLFLPKRPLRLDLDPDFDLFRGLEAREAPPAFSRLFGANRLLLVLPAAETEMLAAYRQLAEALAQSGPEEVAVALDRDLEELPGDRAVILLGWHNRFSEAVAEALAGHDAMITDAGLRIGGRLRAGRDGFGVAVAVEHPHNPALALGWIGVNPAAMIPALARKLPHYHRYGALVFQGEQAENLLKESWPSKPSPLTVFTGEEQPPPARRPAAPPLAD